MTKRGGFDKWWSDHAVDVFIDDKDLALKAWQAALNSQEWQPIETAPKDEPFWGKIADDVVYMYWDSDFNQFITGCRLMQTHSGYTFNDGSTSMKHSPDIKKPTHWMPLPQPPQETK